MSRPKLVGLSDTKEDLRINLSERGYTINVGHLPASIYVHLLEVSYTLAFFQPLLATLPASNVAQPPMSTLPENI
jgi:hypothetical protein